MRLLNKTPRGKPQDKPHIDFKIRGKIAGITYPCIAEVKYDGISVTFIKKGDYAWITTSRYTRTISDSKDPFTPQSIQDGIYLAEWIFDYGFWDTLKHVSDRNFGETKLKVFDVLVVNGDDVSEKDMLTRKELTAHCIPEPCLPEFRICQNREQLNDYYERCTAAGYEGLVVKNMNESFLMQKWVKMKPMERMTHGTTNNGE